MMGFTISHPHMPSDLGSIPGFLSEADPRAAAEQFGEAWQPLTDWKMDLANGKINLQILGLHPIAWAVLHYSEMILIYEMSMVAIVQLNTCPRTYEIGRMS